MKRRLSNQPPQKNANNDQLLAQMSVISRQSMARIGVKSALRRSGRIGFLKKVLPIMAISIAVVALSWQYLLPDETKFHIEAKKTMPRVENNSRMIGPKFLGVDAQGHGYVITGKEAIQYSDQNGLIELVTPNTDIAMGDRGWLSVSSKIGRLKNLEKSLELLQSVSLYSADGLELHMEQLLINLKTNDLMTKTAVTGQGPTLTLDGEGMTITNNGKKIQLLGKSQLVLRND